VECCEIDRNLLVQAIDEQEALDASPGGSACDEASPYGNGWGGSEP
jgi:hypothetical protein